MYYTLDEIMSKKDLDGREPSIFLITTNRSAGKTTAVLKYMLEDFKNTGAQAVLIYRHNYETSAASMIFEDVLKLYPDLGTEMIAKSYSKGLFYQLFLDGEPFGYSVSLNNPDAMKKYSPLFADVENALFDEFQTENGKYLDKEPEKLQSLYLTIGRGGGSQSRDIKLFMLSNSVSIMNPYFIQFGIYKRIKSNTHFIRGNGWIAELGFNESASEAIQNSAIYRAFNGNQSNYMSYSVENIYLYDSEIFISSPSGKSKYLFTIVHGSEKYGVREYYEEGLIYVSRKPDPSFPRILTFKPGDHNQNTIMLNHNSEPWKYLREAFQSGFLRFDDVKAKNVIFEILAVDIYK